MASFIKRVWTAKIGHWIWALADQGVVSLGTFLTNVILARTLLPADYGVYALICGVMYFLNSQHSALVTVPLSIKGAGVESLELSRMATGSIALTILLAIPMAAIVSVATWTVGHPDVALWAIIALLFWQFQETIRRTFMTRLRHGQAVWGDTIRYLGQAALVWIATNNRHLSVKDAFIIMALASGAGALVQMVQHGLGWMRPAEIRRLGSVFWGLGRWILMTNFVGAFMIQVYPWTLAFFYGAAASAQLQAAANILGISHPIAFGIGSLICPAVARAMDEHGEREATRVGFNYGFQGGLLLLPFYLTLLLWPQWGLQLFYGTGSPYLDLTDVLRLFVLCYLVTYLANVTVTILNGLERTRVAFFSELASVLTTLTIGLPLTVWGGVIGAVAGGLLTSLTRFAAGGLFLKQMKTTRVVYTE